MSNYTIVAGTTTPLRFQLLEAGSPINLFGITVTLILSDRNGTTVDTPGTVTTVDSDEGIVQLAPTDEDVFVSANSPYTARWKLEDLTAKISYVPTGPRDIWEIIGE